MKLTVSTIINSSLERVWKTITDFENMVEIIPSITSIDILIKPEVHLVGFKWKETRVLFGKKASEVMWVEEAEENSYLSIAAASHGMEYRTNYTLEEESAKVRLTVEFSGKAKTKMARLISMTTGLIFRNATKKALLSDLNEFKKAIE